MSRRRRLVLALVTIGAAFFGAALAEEPIVIGVDPTTYYEVLSVGPADPEVAKPVYVWNEQPRYIGQMVAKVLMEQFRTSRFETCLSEFAKTRPGLYEALISVRTTTSAKTMQSVDATAKRVWTKFGVDQALAEVAGVGRPGRDTEALFEVCDKLSARKTP